VRRPFARSYRSLVLELLPNPLILPVGIAVGVLIAAPVGPVNIICIQRAIERGVAAGILAGTGAVLGDGLIALLAALGVGQITGAIGRYRELIQLVGGVALAVFGVHLSRTKPRFAPQAPAGVEWSSLGELVWDVPKTFLLTVTNPGAVLGLVAIFSGVSSFVDVQSTVQALWLVAAIVAGSLMWWVALSSMVGRIRHRVTETRLAQINYWAGVMLVAFGAVLVGELAVKMVWRTLRLAVLG
jgi:threonine/homoserine/homoserine lactone efflux protein